MNLTIEQKLLAILLCDIHQNLGINNSLNASFIKEAIQTGNDWALEWELENSSIPIQTISRDVVDFICNVLTMSEQVSYFYSQLSNEEQERVITEISPFTRTTIFQGFDGNNESEYRNAASFLVNNMNKFADFSQVINANSHTPMIDTYQRMYDVYQNVYQPLIGNQLSCDNIISILQARANN